MIAWTWPNRGPGRGQTEIRNAGVAVQCLDDNTGSTLGGRGRDYLPPAIPSVTRRWVIPRPLSITSSRPPPRRDSRAWTWEERLERTKVLTPGASANCTFASLTLRVRVATLRLPSLRTIRLCRTVIVASAFPVQTPPSPSHASTSEIPPLPRVMDRLLATPARMGEETRPAGRGVEAGGALASACAHPFTQAEIASTRVNTDGLVVAHSLYTWLATPICTMPPAADGSATSNGPPLSPLHAPVRWSGVSIAQISLAGPNWNASRSQNCGLCTTVCAHCSRSSGVSSL